MALLGPAYLVGKILGPTADYIGEGVREWSERRTENVRRIFENAGGKLGDRLDSPGTVPPKVLGAVLAEGQFAEEPLSTEYIGGLLASSRTQEGRDDRGAADLATLGRLSVYEIRAHYLIYATARSLLAEELWGLAFASHPEHAIYFPLKPFEEEGMGYTPEEYDQRAAITSHVFNGLSRERLIWGEYTFGTPDDLRGIFGRAFPEAGIVVSITPQGAQLFLRAHGLGGLWTTYCNLSIELPDFVPVPRASARRLRDMLWNPPMSGWRPRRDQTPDDAP